MIQVNARSRDQQLEPLPVSSQGGRADDRKPIQGVSKISEDGLSRAQHSRQSQGRDGDAARSTLQMFANPQTYSQPYLQ